MIGVPSNKITNYITYYISYIVIFSKYIPIRIPNIVFFNNKQQQNMKKQTNHNI